MLTARKSRITGAALLGGLLAVLAFAGCAPKKTIAGDWSGPLEVLNPMTSSKATLHLVFHIAQEDNGNYNATLDVAEQKAAGIKLDSVTVKDSDVNMALNIGPAHATFAGKIDANYSKITGQWSQASLSIPLELTKDPEKTGNAGTVVEPGKK